MKKKVIMIGVVLIVCLGTIFYNMQKRDPYKSYNHLKTSEVLKVKEFNRYWVYFYSMDNQESMDSKNGIARLNKAVSNVYFVKIKDKEVVIENQKDRLLGEIIRVSRAIGADDAIIRTARATMASRLL